MRVKVVLIHRQIITINDTGSVEDGIRRARVEASTPHRGIDAVAWTVEHANIIPIPQDAA